MGNGTNIELNGGDSRPFTPREILDHSGLLRLDLTRRGVRLTDPSLAESNLAFMRYEMFTRGLDLILPGGLWANVPFQGSVAESSPYRLEKSGSSMKLLRDEVEEGVEIQLIPKPDYYGHRTESGRLFASIANVHGSFVYIFPFDQCIYIHDNEACAYCAFETSPPAGNPDAKPLEEVLQVLKTVFRETTPELVYLSVGHLSEEDGGIAALEPYVRMIKKNFDTLVGIEVMAPYGLDWVVRAYAMGVDAICFSMGVFSREAFARYMPGRAHGEGYERYFASLKYAASIFPRGAVYTRLMAGMEPLERTREGIDKLTDFGVVPLLPLYVPHGIERLPPPPPPPALPLETLVGFYRAWRRTLIEKRLDTYWVRPISMATMPIDGHGFEPPLPGDKRGPAGEYKTWERRAHRWGAALRRRIRIRSVE